MPLGEVGNRALRVEGRAPGGQAGLVSEMATGQSTRMGALGPGPDPTGKSAPKPGTAAPAPAPGGPHTPTLRPGRVDSLSMERPLPPALDPTVRPRALQPSLSLENDLIFTMLLQFVIYLFVNYFSLRSMWDLSFLD